MKTQFLKNVLSNIPAIAAISCFLIFSSLNKDASSPSASQCCSGYSMPTANLEKFMLDSLTRFQFEGGIYSKADLLSVINSLSSLDDSVYLLNTLINCNTAQGTDLALTSRHSTVQFVRAKQCHGCPNKPCCRNSVCVARINRGCINYAPFAPSAFNITSKADSYTVPEDSN